MGEILGGKTKTYKADPLAAQAKRLGGIGLNMQEDALRKLGDTKGLASAEIARRERGARAGGEDQMRRARQMSAQRGLGGTSIGLAMESQAAQRAGENMQAIRAQRGNMERGFAQENLAAGRGAFKQMGPIQMNERKIKSKGIGGALLSAGGAAIGGMYGGAAGAKVGSSIGGAFGEGIFG
jgi:hypothetical protein